VIASGLLCVLAHHSGPLSLRARAGTSDFVRPTSRRVLLLAFFRPPLRPAFPCGVRDSLPPCRWHLASFGSSLRVRRAWSPTALPPGTPCPEGRLECRKFCSELLDSGFGTLTGVCEKVVTTQTLCQDLSSFVLHEQIA